MIKKDFNITNAPNPIGVYPHSKRVGDLLFFTDNKIVNHVAICLGNEEIIHSSGCVKIEKLKENKELYKKLYKVMSIKNIIK